MKGPIYSDTMRAFRCHQCDMMRLLRLQDRDYAGLSPKYMLVCTDPQVTHDVGLSYIGGDGETPCWCPYIIEC